MVLFEDFSCQFWSGSGKGDLVEREPPSKRRGQKRLGGFGARGLVGSGGKADPHEAFDERESLSDLSDGFSEFVVVLTQMVVGGVEVIAEFVGAALLLPDDRDTDRQQGDDLRNNINFHAS